MESLLAAKAKREMCTDQSEETPMLTLKAVGPSDSPVMDSLFPSAGTASQMQFEGLIPEPVS